MPEHDASYKLLFSHARLVEDLLKGFVQEDWVEKVDFATLDKVNGSYVADDLRDREDDMIWRVRWGKEWVYIYILLEFQSTVDRHMAVRVMTYVGLLYQDLIRQKLLGAEGKLPVVFPLVLYNGDEDWTAPQSIDALVEPATGSLGKHRLPTRYVLLEEKSVPKEKLSGSSNLVSLLFRLEQCETPEEIVQGLEDFAPWVEKEELASIQRAFATWVNRVLVPARGGAGPSDEVVRLQEVRSMLAKRVKQWTEDWKREGLAQGLEQGLEQGRLQELRSDVLEVLEVRFGAIPGEVRSKVGAMNDDVALKSLHREAITIESMEAFCALV